jgi:hypothetical protein
MEGDPETAHPFEHVRMLDQVQLTAAVLLDVGPDTGRKLRIGAEHLLNLVIEGMPCWIARHRPILSRPFRGRYASKPCQRGTRVDFLRAS